MILLCMGVGCEPAEEAIPATGLLADQDPVEIGAADAVPLLSWEVGTSPLVRIGGSDERESHLLVQVGDGVLAWGGSIIVTDTRIGVVRVYDASGRFVENLGTAGDGPGEFRSPGNLYVAPADSILVWDEALWRTSLFSPTGDFVRSERYDAADPDLFPIQGMWPSEIRLGPGGARLVRLTGKANAKGADGDSEPPKEGVMGFALHFPGAADLDLIESLPEPAAVRVEAPWGRQEMIPPLPGEPQAEMDPQGLRVCLGYSGVPEVLCQDGSSSPVSARWVSDRRPVRAEDPDVAGWRQETLATFSQKLSRGEVEDLLSQVPLPERAPAFRSLHLDGLGLLWVELGPVEEDWGLREYLILDRGLQAVGRLQLPSLRILEIGEDHLLGVRKDPVGREEVVLYSLLRR